MTALDRAFIKAYADMPTASRPRMATGEPHATPGPAGPHELARPPRRPFGTGAERTIELAPPTPASGGALNDSAHAPKAPLSAFAPAPTADDKIRAGVEVDEICWPSECIELIERARRGFDRFVDHLTERITREERCIAIAGFCPGDGRTLITLATAKHLATRGIHTVMVDANFENPMLAPSCRITPQCGWCEAVSGQKTLEEALITSRSDGVTLVPCRGRSQSVAPPGDSAPLTTTFATLKEQYDLVLLDTAALDSPTAVASFAGLAEAVGLDAIYLVRDTRTTSVEEMAATCSALQASAHGGGRHHRQFRGAGRFAPPADAHSLAQFREPAAGVARLSGTR